MYNSTAIQNVLRRLNRSHFLPAIQRPYVWDVEQICGLFDSLMQGFPISSFLFWEVRSENRQNLDMYEFVANVTHGDVHNGRADPQGEEAVLVLDGQQRLTSLLIGLGGTYKVKQKHKRRSNPSAFNETKLYLNLIHTPSAADREPNRKFDFRFFANAPVDDSSHIWYRVGDILNYDSIDRFDAFKDNLEDRLPRDTPPEDRRRIRNTLDRLHRVVWKDEVICYYTEVNQDYDRVVNIFIRANDGGTKLSKADLLLSLMTSNWSKLNARDEVLDFISHLNKDLKKKNDFDKDFVLRACLMATGLDCSYNMRNFTRENLCKIEEQWDDVKRAVRSAVLLVNRFGLDGETLTGANALMPIIYYLKQTRHNLLGQSEFELRNAERVRVWLAGALLGSLFTGWADIVLRKTRELVKDGIADSDEFPLESLARDLFVRGKQAMYSEPFFRDIMETTTADRSRVYLCISLLYDLPYVDVGDLRVDHIFPRSLFLAKSAAVRARDPVWVEKCKSAADRLGNLILLPADEYTDKAVLSFGQWIDRQNDDFVERHLLPDPALWTPDTFLKFVEERERRILARLRSLVGHSKTAPLTIIA